jgi:hypothetical protein
LGVQVTDTGGNTDWLLMAACKNAAKQMFFPGSGYCKERAARQAFEMYCRRCPVWKQCLKESEGETDGIWAGLSPAARQLVKGKPKEAWAKAVGMETR